MKNVMKVEETEVDAISRIRERFSILEDMTRAVKSGKVRACIVSGAPGVGKSHGIEKVLGFHDMFANIAQDQSLKKYEIVKGVIGELGIYKKLYEYRHEKNILVFDDSDDAFANERSLNLLKSALDTGKKRMLAWHYDSRQLKEEGIPNSFEFKGGVIFVTNLDFTHVRSKILRQHLQALSDRCHYFDLSVHSISDKILRIKQVVADGMLDEIKLSEDEKEQVVDFITSNQNKLKLLSLRTVKKTAELVDAFPDKWRDVAKITLMT